MEQDAADPTIADELDQTLLAPLSDKEAGSYGLMIKLLYSDSCRLKCVPRLGTVRSIYRRRIRMSAARPCRGAAAQRAVMASTAASISAATTALPIAALRNARSARAMGSVTIAAYSSSERKRYSRSRHPFLRSR